MKKIILLLFVYFSFSPYVYAQINYALLGDRTYGGDDVDEALRIIPLANHEYMLCGSSVTFLNGDKTDDLCPGSSNIDWDVWVLKLDSNFNVLWDRSYGGDKSEAITDAILGHNNTVIFASESKSDSSCEKTEHNRAGIPGSSDFWICAIDTNNNVLWNKTLGTIGVESYPRITQLSSGDIIVAGLGGTIAPSGDKTVTNHGAADYWVIKLDSAGNKLWDNVYGGSGFEGNYQLTLINDNNNFILGGTTDSPQGFDISDTSRGMNDVWIIKLDSAGNKIWDKRFGGSHQDYCTHIMPAKDKGYFICGETYSPQGLDVSEPSRGGLDFWLIKIDSLGNKQWDKRYGGNNNDFFTWMEPAIYGNQYWIAGYTESDAGGDVSGNNIGISPYPDFWILKIDSIGNKLFDGRYGSATSDLLGNFLVMPDTSILMCGESQTGITSVKSDSGKGEYDYWLFHFIYDDSGVGLNENNYANNNVKVSPNPFKESITVTSNTTTSAEFTLYDVTARKMLTKTFSHSVVINTSQLSSGIYLYSVKNKTGIVGVGKVIKN